MSSRRTGPTSESSSATCASTPRPSSWCSTGSGPSTRASPTCCSPSRSSSAAPGWAPRSSSATTAPKAPISACWPPGASPRPKQAALTQSPQRPPSDTPSGRDRPALHPARTPRVGQDRTTPAGRQPGLHPLARSAGFFVRQRITLGAGFDVRQQAPSLRLPTTVAELYRFQIDAAATPGRLGAQASSHSRQPAAQTEGLCGARLAASSDYRLVMARHSLRSQLYRAARDLGDVQAASRGPGSYAKRVARRKVYRTTDGMTRHLLRDLNL